MSKESDVIVRVQRQVRYLEVQVSSCRSALAVSTELARKSRNRLVPR